MRLSGKTADTALRALMSCGTVVMLILTNGCGAIEYSGGSNNSSASSASSVIAEDGTHFSGPYAADFKQLYEGSSNDFVKSAVKDGEISDSELLEYEQRFSECLAGKGYKLAEHLDASGEVLIAKTDGTDIVGKESMTAERYCEKRLDFDDFFILYQEVTNNPDRLNQVEFDNEIAKCLQRNSLGNNIADGKEYRRFVADDFAYERLMNSLSDEQLSIFRSCESSPLQTS